ncbi:hypothetical protein CHH28_00130 [Bacterioplanes sanyensis]|uniref:MSHA biogenesis protein MshI n=1 Tax=Bacterioplanes sanyensis TaxID=1249553 RepID=A0A222FF38_9GAMM|nr:hypothetical protein [Bacterioplanes sanyensis]ASP37186.1 hypothetical protein CHH28_00130 [Bacterioplanes sanyensis]
MIWKKGWRWPGKQAQSQYSVGIELHQQQAFAVCFDGSAVTRCYRPQDDETGLDGVARWLKQHGLQGSRVYLSLDHQHYEVHLLEAAAVPDDELSDAMRFRVKDMLANPIEDMVVQATRLPDDAYRGRLDMAFVSAVRRDHLRSLVDWCQQQELQLCNISLSQFHLLNLMAELGPEQSVALLRLDAHDGALYVYYDGALYLERPLAIGCNDLKQITQEGEFALETDSQLERLSLELQRSMDFYESQIGMGSIGQIWILKPDHGDLDDTMPLLETALNVPVRQIVLDTQFNQMADDDAGLSASLLTALGGVSPMRTDVKQHINFYVEEFHPPTLAKPVAYLLASLAINGALLLVMGVVLWWLATQQVQETEQWQLQREQVSEELQQLQDSLPPLQQDPDLVAQQQRLQQQRIGAQAALSYLTRGQLEESQSFTRMLRGLGQVANQGVWLQGVRIDDGGESLALRGYLQRPQQLSSYVEALLQQPGYRGRAFRHIQIEEVEDQSWLQFELASEHAADQRATDQGEDS